MKKKGIILAGGTGSRLYPLTKVTNKCLLPIGKKPMINHLLDLYIAANIKEVMVITGPEHMGHIVNLLGSGSDYECDITYKIQDKSNGIAAALGLCETFGKDSKLAVILGDNIFENYEELIGPMRNFFENDDSYHLFIKSVDNPSRFGVPIINDNCRITDIIEKPHNPPNNFAVTGLYMYTDHVFDVIKTLKPSNRGEFEISDVNSYFVKNKVGNYTVVKNGWIDAGTFDSYLQANIMVSK